MKKILKFALLIIIVAGASFGVSLWWSQRGQSVVINRFSDANANTANSLTQVTTSAQGSVKLTNDDASFPFFIPNRGEVRYYVSRTGEIKSLDLRKLSAKAKVVATIKPRAIALTWSPDGTQVIATYGSDHIAINLTSGISRTLDRKISAPEFSRNSDQVAYAYFDPETAAGSIAIADTQFKDFKNILKTRLKNWELQWNNERRLSLIATTATTKLNTLFLLDIDHGALETLLDSKINLEANWAPNGNTLLYSRQTRRGLELSLFSVATRHDTQLNFPGTASKCAWTPDSQTLYCAVPGKPMQLDDLNSSDDTFVKIDVTHPEKSPETFFTAADASFVDAREMLYAPVQQALIFRNFKDGRLYMLSLAK